MRRLVTIIAVVLGCTAIAAGWLALQADKSCNDAGDEANTICSQDTTSSKLGQTFSHLI